MAILTTCCDRRPEPRASSPDAPPTLAGTGQELPTIPAAPRSIDSFALLEQIRSCGRPTVLYIWASWCKGSLQQFPALVELQRLHLQGQIQLLALAIDSPADVSAYLEPWLAGQGIRFPVFYKDPDEGDARLVQALGGTWLGTVPATFLYDAAGRLIERTDGAVTRETVRSRLLTDPS